MFKSKSFLPEWRNDVPAAGTYRSIFKYDPNKFKHPSRAWFEMFKSEFGMTDDDFRKRQPGGDEQVRIDHPITVTDEQMSAFISGTCCRIAANSTCRRRSRWRSKAANTSPD